jgi:hypothetical protein
MKPPLTPEEQLQRILRIARINGLSVVIIAGLSLLISLGDWFGMAICAAVVGGGWLELAGRKQLLAGDAAGVRRLVQAELVVLAAVEIYCVVKLARGMSPELRELIAAMDMPELEPSFRSAFAATYIAAGLLTIVYQGGMARYYSRHAATVRSALEARARPATPGAGRPNSTPEDWVT